jgi:uncharacterized protein (TIGR02246 family)
MGRSRSFVKPLLLGFVLGAAVTGGWFFAERTRSGGQALLAAPEVTAMLQAQQSAWNAGDLESFMDAYADDLVFYTGGNVLEGREALTKRYRQRYQKDGKEMGKLTFSGLDVQTIGPDAAYARGRWKVEMKDGTAPEGLFTLVLRRFPYGWKIVHDHTSAADPPKSP